MIRELTEKIYLPLEKSQPIDVTSKLAQLKSKQNGVSY